jgi:hypothetical protein
MQQDIVCPKCSQPTETGATFCGNCGFRLIPENSQTYLGQVSTQLATSIPVYATPKNHHKRHWAALALVFGLLGIAASLLLPLVGIIFGIVGIILISSSFSIARGWVKPSGLVVSILSIFVGILLAVVPQLQNSKTHAAVQPGTTNGVATISIETPCYSIRFKTFINIDNNKGSCSINAYNGVNFDTSSNIYKIVASSVSNINSSNFDSVSKTAIASDIAKHLPGFNITSQNSDTFDGASAYSVYAYDPGSNIAMIEESVLDSGSSGNNFFVIIHAVNGQSTNLNSLKAGWQWND